MSSKSNQNKFKEELEMRSKNIHNISKLPMQIRRRNLNELDHYVGAYHKGLPCDNTGLVDEESMKKLLKAIKYLDTDKLDQVTLGGKLQLVNPSACWSKDFFGVPIECYDVHSVPEFKSAWMAAEIIEIYAMAYCRDITFAQYKNSIPIKHMCEALNTLSDYKGIKPVTPNNIFTSIYDKGFYISQFLLQNYNEGGVNYHQKYPYAKTGRDYGTDYNYVLQMQKGNVNKSEDISLDTRYIISGRDLARYVHLDEPYQIGTRAAGILNRITKLRQHSDTQSFFVEVGKVDYFDMLGRACKLSMMLGWAIKYRCMMTRPEELGLVIENARKSGVNTYELNEEILTSKALKKTYEKQGNHLLSQAYPEGCPAHPSYPSGHACYAGAIITVLKYYFDTDIDMDMYIPSNDGSNLILAGKANINDELNKLASNTAFGRNFAGIHYRMDVSGITYGETVAINLLKDMKSRCGFLKDVTITLYNGDKTTI